MSPTQIDENALTKGQRRKLNALRKSVGTEIGEQAFAAWLASQPAGGEGGRERGPDRRYALAARAARRACDPAGRLSAQTRPRPGRHRAGAAIR